VARLTLLIPGLLDGTASDAVGGHTPALARLLGRARLEKAPAADRASLLAHQFGVVGEAHLPVAALTRLADTGEADGCWLRADPVHLQADLSQVLLSPQPLGDLDAADATALVASLNESFRELGWTFDVPHPQRWYLRLDAPPDICTHPLQQVRGRDIHPFLPEGADARVWRSRLNEIQMLLFDHPVNRQREARGQVPVNSVWFWGEGTLPEKARSPAMEVHGAGPLLRGLARVSGAELHPPPASAADWRQAGGGDSLVVLDDLTDAAADPPGAWLAALARLERDWFAPLLADLQRGRLRELVLHPADGRVYRLGPARSWRLWQRPRDLPGAVGEAP